SINYTAPNPKIDFESSPFYVVDKVTALEKSSGPPRVALSSFGIGGTNVHAILEAFPTSERAEVDFTGPYLVPLSAKKEKNLKQYAFELARELEQIDQASTSLPTLADIAFTLQAGRTAMPVRVAFIVDSVSELIDVLQDFANGTNQSAHIRGDSSQLGKVA